MNDLPRGSALVIGIDAYEGGIAPLGTAANDAREVASLLESQHGYSVRLLRNDEANGAGVMHLLEKELPGAVSSEEPFLFYFAGHGLARGDGSAGPEGFLLPCDAVPGEPSTWLSMNRIHEALQTYGCKHLLVVLDCCFAGSFRWASTRHVGLAGMPLYESQYQRYLRGTAWQVLTSAAHDEQAADHSPGSSNTRDHDTQGDHSPFAHALLSGLSGAADSARSRHGPDGIITAMELYQYLFEELVPVGAPSRQTPGIWPLKPDNTGDYIFRNPSVPKCTLPDPPLDDRNNPWLGLRPYSENEAGLFFGRETVVEALVDRVLGDGPKPFIAVVGASGTGKSSVVKAGLVPRLANPAPEHQERTGQWTIEHTARLSSHPMNQLDRSLERLGKVPAGRSRLLIIDQFEELYTQCRDSRLQEQFLGRLRELMDEPNGLTVIVTLRTDFEPRPAQSQALADIWPAARFLVPAMTVEEYREVIEGPAQIKALYFEPAGLVDELLDEVVAMPGALPLLSFALAELYRRAQIRRRESGSPDRALSREDYESTGGVVGAVHRRATVLFERSDPLTRVVIRRLFLRMVSQEGARLARRRVRLSELEFPDPDDQKRARLALDTYLDARLLVLDDGYIEPAHDTLVVAWEKLQDWLAERGSQELLRAVWRAARNWEEHDRSRGFLWNSDPRLPQLQAMKSELNSLETVFVGASARIRKWRTWSIVGVTVAVIAALSFATWYSLEKAAEATRSADFAEARRLVTVGLGQLDAEQPGASLQTAIAALQATRRHAEYLDTAETLLYQSIDMLAPRDPLARHLLHFDGRASALVLSVDYSPDGDWLATGDSAGNALLWPLFTWADWRQTLERTVRLELEPGRPEQRGGENLGSVFSTRYSPNGPWLARATSAHGALLSDGENRLQLHRETEVVSDLAYSSSGGILATVTDGTRITFWEGLPDRQEATAWFESGDVITDVVFERTGHWFAAGSQDGTVRLWDLSADSREPEVLGGSEDSALALAFGPSTLLAAHRTGVITAWPLPPGEKPLLRIETGSEPVTALAVSRDGQWLASGSRDGRIQLRRMDEPQATPRFLVGHDRLVSDLAFSPDSRQLASASYDSSVRLWPMEHEQLIGLACYLTVAEEMWHMARAGPEELEVLATPRPATDPNPACAAPLEAAGREFWFWALVATPDAEELLEIAARSGDPRRLEYADFGGQPPFAPDAEAAGRIFRFAAQAAAGLAAYAADQGDAERAAGLSLIARTFDPEVDLSGQPAVRGTDPAVTGGGSRPPGA